MFGNNEFKLIVVCNLYSIVSSISILKSCKLKLYFSLNDKAGFCTICHILDWILMDKISNFLKICVNSACRSVVLICQM